jgi:hypothetical protein
VFTAFWAKNAQNASVEQNFKQPLNYLIADQILMVISISACEPSSACGWHTLFILSALLREFCIPQT